MYVCRNNILQPIGRLLVSQTSLAFLKKWYRQYFFSWHFEVAKTSKLNLVGASLNSMWNCHVCDLLWCVLFQNRLYGIVSNLTWELLVISRRQLRKYWLYEYVLLDVGFQFWSRTEKDQKDMSISVSRNESKRGRPYYLSRIASIHSGFIFKFGI